MMHNFETAILAAIVMALLGGSGFAQEAAASRKGSANIYVHGLVSQPGRRAWTPGVTLLDVLSQNSDAQHSQQIDRIAIVRKDERLSIVYSDLIGGKVPNPKLLPDDRIQVPDFGPRPGKITIIRDGERIQITQKEWRARVDRKLEANDIVIIHR